MSTLNKHFPFEQVYYLGKKGQKWDITVKGNEQSRKYVVKVQRALGKWIFPKSKKPEIVELVPNSHAVIFMESLDNHKNIVALVPVSRSCQHIRSHFFTSQKRQSIRDLKDFFSRCCDVISFDVDIEEGFIKESCNLKMHLHIFCERICIIQNQGYNFKVFREWPLEFCRHVMTTSNGVKLIMSTETLALRTQQGNDIKSKIAERLPVHSPGSHHLPIGSFSASTHDKNYNSIAQHLRRREISCDSLLELDDSLVSEENRSLLTDESSAPSQRQSSSPGQRAFSSDENVCREDCVDVQRTLQDVHCFSDSCLVTSLREHATHHDNGNYTQKLLMELQADNKPVVYTGEIMCTRHAQDDGPLTPPPIPLRQLKPTANIENPEFDSVKKAVPCGKVVSKTEIPRSRCFPRSRSFQIVEQPQCPKIQRQCYNSDSTNARKPVTELVQLVCKDPIPEKNANTKGDNFENSDDVCATGPENCSLTNCQDEHIENSVSATDNETCGNGKIHYVNLPAGSRPSCYLYMNQPDLTQAPKEQATYINHDIYMSRSMKGIYKNVFGSISLSSEERETLPPLPPPILHPRKPPPRIPERLGSDRRRLQQKPDTLREAGLPPPPRPPKRQKVDIQVQGAVFASRAVAGRAWYLRIVVMRHDQDDFTFKKVKDREIASNYHLVQTFPFNVSSDIIISLKHNCKQFKVTSEDYQEIDYEIIEKLDQFWFVIEFHLQHLGTKADQFVGYVCMEPKNLPAGEKCPVNKKFNLGITEEFELKQPWSHCAELGKQCAGENSTSKCVISDFALRKDICEKLDGTIYASHNWRDVAGHLGVFPADEIKFIENKAHRSVNFSPMDYVLSVWEQRDPSCCIERLVSILKEIQRHDIVMDLGFPEDLESP